MRAGLAALTAFLLAADALHAGPPRADTPRADAPPADSAQGDSVTLELPASRVKARRREEPPIRMDGDFIRRIPGTLNDPVRAAGFAPGVTVQNDVNVRPLVRGGDAEETRVVLNGIPLMQPYHIGGVFSLFNLGTLDAVELYRDDFPVEYPGALSGLLRLETKTRMPDRPGARATVSLLRGDIHAEIPVVPDGFSVFGAAQSFMFNRSVRGILDGASSLSGEPQFKHEMAGYRERVNLPDFEDFHWGASLARPGARADYMGTLSWDKYGVVIPSQTNILSKINPNFGDPTAPVGQGLPNRPEPKPEPKPKSNPVKRKISVDSVSAVDIGNQAHFVRLAWDIDARNLVEQDFGFQAQDWDVDFKEGAAGAAPGLSLLQSSRYFNYRLAHTWTPGGSHRVRLGASYDYRRQEYRVDMPYVLYDVMVNGNMDMLEPLGMMAGGGFTIVKQDSALSNLDYLGEYPARIRFSHAGVLHEGFLGGFLSHSWRMGTGTLDYGLRAEYHDMSEELFPCPRAEFRQALGETDELAFKAGLYAQNDLPWYQRDRNPRLRSEKSAQGGLRWTRRLGKGWKLAADGYYKRYFDLVTPVLVPDGTLDLKGILLPRPDAPLSPGQAAELEALIGSGGDPSSLPDSTRQAVYAAYGGLQFDYRNAGLGNSLGLELTLDYRPSSAWKGWLSADFNLSNRSDGPGRPWYPFAQHRPVAVNWVNRFDVPGDFDLGCTYRWALGRPYTPYSGSMDGTGLEPIRVGARNSGRLAPYSRLDLRLARGWRPWGRNLQGYLEIWNAMNSPNYFSRDAETGQLKAAQLNFPFPVAFVGMTAEL